MQPKHLPNEDDLRRLPRWAFVAFVARCAMRLYPFYQGQNLNMNTNVSGKDDLAYAIWEVEECATRAGGSDGGNKRGVGFMAAVTKDIVKNNGHLKGVVAKTIQAISYAVTAASQAAFNEENPYLTASFMIGMIADVSKRYPDRMIISSLLNDFTTIEENVKQNEWNDDAPVNPRFFPF